MQRQPTDEEFAKTHAGWTCILNIKCIPFQISDTFGAKLVIVFVDFPHGVRTIARDLSLSSLEHVHGGVSGRLQRKLL